MKHTRIRRRAGTNERGSALTMVMVTIFLMIGLTFAFFSMTASAHQEVRSTSESTRALYLAESALHEGVAIYQAGGRPAVDAEVYPKDYGGAFYDLDVVWGEDDPGMGNNLVRMIGRAADGREEVAVELVMRTDGAGDFPSGVIGKTQLLLLNLGLVDSFDSGAGDYTSQAANTWNGRPYANSMAPVRCNGDISLNTTSSIWGDAHPGPSDTVSIGGSSQVTGSTSPLPSPIPLPTFTVPSFPSSGNLLLASGSQTLFSGDYEYDSLDLDGTGVLTIEGPATVVLGSADIDDDSRLWIDDAAGPVEVYVTGMYHQDDNTIVSAMSEDPAGLSLFVSGNSPDVEFWDAASFIGTVYAPDRNVQIRNSFQLLGSVVADVLTLDGTGGVHFDESLLGTAGSGGGDLEVLSWRPIGDESN